MPTSFNTEEAMMAAALSKTPVRSQANDGKFNIFFFFDVAKLCVSTVLGFHTEY